MTPEDIKRAVRAVLTEERMLEGLRDHLPPPSDIEAERVVLGALVAGEVALEATDALIPEAFYLPLHRWVFARLLEGAQSAADLTAAAEGEGLTGPSVAERLDELQWQPVVMLPPFAHWVERVANAYRARVIWSECQRVSIELRSGALSADAAAKRLLAAVGSVYVEEK